MAKKQYDLLFKLLLIGDSGVGKTCILYRFSEDQFNTSFISTIGKQKDISSISVPGLSVKELRVNVESCRKFRSYVVVESLSLNMLEKLSDPKVVLCDS